jgi:hypothetical protein
MRPMFLAAAAVSLIACTVEAPDTSTTTQNVESHNRLASNRLASNRLASNRLASNRLASNRLASNSISSVRVAALQETSDILANATGRIVYSYLMSCALDSNTTVVAENIVNEDCGDVTTGCVVGAPANDDYCGPSALNGPFAAGHCEFGGGVGVAPRWLDKKLDPKGQGWVSACMFARINAYDTAESISMRGRNEALSVSTDEASIYTIEEGAFFGDMFGTDPIDWNACEGEGQASGEFGGLELRDCTEPNPATPGLTYCGFTYAGHCGDYSGTGEAHACSGDPNGAYTDCRVGKGKKYREVITTFVAN